MSDDRTDRIRNKIAASQARSSGKAPSRKRPSPGKDRAAPGNLFEQTLDRHPLALLAGSIVIGAVAAALVPRSVGGKLGSRLRGAAALALELGALYGSKTLDTVAQGARDGREKLGDLGETVADQGADARRRASEFGAQAGKRAIELAGVAARNARNARGGALKALADLSDRVRN